VRKVVVQKRPTQRYCEENVQLKTNTKLSLSLSLSFKNDDDDRNIL